jgi:hypothetical protein
VSGEQMLEHGVDAPAFLGAEFRIFVKGEILGPTDSLDLAEHTDRFAFQSVQFFTHVFGGTARDFTGRVEEHNGTFVLGSRLSAT